MAAMAHGSMVQGVRLQRTVQGKKKKDLDLIKLK